MGCCISSNKKFPHQPKPPVMPEPDINNRANTAPPPPPPCLEEETVKEVVLSETPLAIPQQNPKGNTTQMAIIQECNNIVAEDLNLIIKKHQEEEEETSQVSHVSEIHSISESLSSTTTKTTTTTVALTEIKGDEATCKETSRELNYRSPAKVPKKRPNAGEISRGAKSPVMSRPVPGRTVPRNVGPIRVRRESGGGFSSRSPATGTAGGVRRRSPGKVTPGRAGGKLQVKNEGKEVNDGVLVEKSDLNEPLPLDNHPRVSLECFIFLQSTSLRRVDLFGTVTAGEISRGAKSPVMSRPVLGRRVPRNVEPIRVRRESGGGFSSQSPATGTAGGVRRRSPGKVTTGRAGGKLQVKNEGKEVNDGVLVEKSELNEPLPLDNHPRVSLECFIFL